MVLWGFARFADMPLEERCGGGGGVVIYCFTNIKRGLKFTDHTNK